MIFEHRLAAIAVARRLDGTHLERAAQAVDDQRGQRFAFDFFGHNQQRLAGVDHLLQNRHQFLDVGNFLLVHQHVGVFQHALHLLRIGDEVRRQITAVELHAFDPFGFGLQALAFVDRDDAVFADALHGIGQNAADFGVVVGGHRWPLGPFRFCL